MWSGGGESVNLSFGGDILLKHVYVEVFFRDEETMVPRTVTTHCPAN